MTGVVSVARVWVVVDHTQMTQLHRLLKFKNLHWFYWSVFLAYQVFIICQKHLAQSFCYTLCSRCNDTLNLLFTSLLTKNI